MTETALAELDELLCKPDALSSAEQDRLQTLLLADPIAMERYLAMTELEVWLQRDESIRAALLRADQPENVVALPGARPQALEKRVPEMENGHPFVKWTGMAAAMVIALSGLAWSLRTSEVPAVVADEGTTSPKTEEAMEPTPEDQYQAALLADVGTGSLQRPPTPFVKTGGAIEKISFNRDVRPILADNCYHCHGPDANTREADLRLDTEEEARAVLAADPQESELFLRVVETDPDSIMPPPESHKTLTKVQIETIRRWLVEGAEWEAHWAFIAPVRGEAGDSIDEFVEARLRKEGLSFAPEADRYTLVRRATLDATGLPPTVDEIQAFIDDDSPEAYEKLVDRLLNTMAYAEHRARYWLDAARYGDTHGLHLDNRRDIWPYRDWVIDAYFKNMPFDQFTIEQLAGDLLPNPTQSQQVATGFNRCNVTTSEGGAIAEEFDVRYAVDRVDTTSTVWLGLTAGCAQCHDHKFDPLTQEEFFQLFAYFNNTTQPAMDGNRPDSPPIIRVYETPEIEAKEKALREELSQITAEQKRIAAAAQTAIGQWSSGVADEPKITEASIHGLEQVEKTLPPLRLDQPFTLTARVRVPDSVEATISIVEAGDYQINLLPSNGVELELVTPDGASLSLKTVQRVKPGRTYHIAFTHDGSGDLRGLKLYLNGAFNSERYPNVFSDSSDGEWMEFAGGEVKRADFVTEVSIASRALTAPEISTENERQAILQRLRKPDDKRNDKERQSLQLAYLHYHSAPYRQQLQAQSAAEVALSQLLRHAPTTLVMNEKPEPATAHILERGEYDQRREEVSPGLPAFLPQPSEELAKNRLGLAQWIVSPENPLTARVTVNRMWQELFGRGLVKTVEDFGTQGETASHPQLLDWLAVEFVENGWDMRSIYREMMLSRTYRQSTVVSLELRQHDPENLLLARGPRFRLDAEVIRDQALAASGLMIDRVGGPSVKPYQPDGIWKAVGYTDSNTQTFFQDYGRDEHRRSLYTFWKRTAAPPNMTIFDAPNRESCTVRRERTNTPLQALVLMNDPQYVRAARHLALRALNEQSAIDERLNFLSLVVRGRPMDEDERNIVKGSLTQFRNAWESGDGEHAPEARELLVDSSNPRFSPELGGHEPIELASWTMVASQMLNLDETVTKE